MLADTPIVKNLDNPQYMKILLDGKASLEELFAHIDPATVRAELQKSHNAPEKIPTPIKRLIRKPTYPQELTQLLHVAAKG